jgi:hypothetical protein
MRNSEHINKYRLTKHPIPQLRTTDADGMNGLFAIPLDKESRNVALCMVSDGFGWKEDGFEGPAWEHVSVRIGEKRKGRREDRVPNWNEMVVIKDLFFQPEECVVQFHPKKSEYVDTNPYCLHLWRLKEGDFPTPPKTCV